ncbi:MAG TPA: prolipoprotein diacylglyceryl transferase [Ktedonobacterales bacterium]|jgi:phosphatidylglycerol:prolipoprotein diacylglycerol transferase
MPSSALTLAYIVINIDPVLQINLGPLHIPIHWYGLAYVLGITIGLWAILRYAKRLGLSEDTVYKVFWWAALAGLLGGRLYFVIQQPNLVDDYLKNPINIIAVWQGGMAFFGAIFLGMLTVAFVSWRQKIPIWLALDIAVLFAAVGQIFGRLGNLVNGDIVGYTAGTLTTAPDTCLAAPCVGIVSDAHILPWATVYMNPHTFAQLAVPYQPAAAYEIVMNLIVLAILFPLRLRLPQIKAGLLSVIYLAGYAISQLIIFFFRGSEPVTPFLGISIFKQAQWTALIVLLLLIPYYLLIQRTSRPWTKEDAAALVARHGTSESDAAQSEAPAPDAAEAEEHKEKAHQESAEEPAHETHHHHQNQEDALREHGLATEYSDALRAELQTEGITVAPPSAEEASAQDGATDGGTADKAQPKSGSRASRGKRSTSKKAAQEGS